MRYRALLLLIFLKFGSGLAVFSQQSYTTIEGTVKDSTEMGLFLVNIIVEDANAGTFTDRNGFFSFRIPKDHLSHHLKVTSVGYDTIEHVFKADTEKVFLSLVLETSITSLREVVIRDRGIVEAPSMRRLPIRDISLIPATGNSIETLLKTLPGVHSPNELSGQYSVRGGSYDENLVYINGIEMYKPQLIKSGRKEGLSIINSDLVGSVYFSPGGFNAKYGDKMSSVLDIRYHEPDEFRGSVNLSLLTNSAHIEGSSPDKKITFLLGARYMTNRFLLRTLDTRASYTPYYFDIQSLITIKTGPESSLSAFFTFGNNSYEFIPVSQRSSFGTFQEAYQLYVDYDGFEQDSYRTINGALTWHLKHGNRSESKFIAQAYSTNENESFDISGRYALNLLDKNLGSENLGDSLINIGIGSWLDHARNNFSARIYIASFDSRWQHANNIINWGIRLKHESLNDRINEWRMIDSAGYSVPVSPAGLELYRSVNTTHSFSSNRFEAFVSDNFTFARERVDYIITVGARLSYWSLNKELLISPRISLELEYSNKLSFYISSGIYYQPPFYREMRYPDGELNKNIRSQKSTHFVLGSTSEFSIGSTPLRLTGEIYYKQLENMIPYKFDNVRVIYSGENSASGSIKGIEMRLYGEFVKNAESWLSVSLMNATHDILSDDYGSYPAPADIRFSTDLFFQDYFPTNPSFRAHIKIHFSTGMPVSSPYDERFDNYYRMPSYRRVDLGFTKVLKDQFSSIRPKSPFSHFENIVVGLEVFNLLDINNTISYHWLTTINNLSGEERQFAVPNYLTGRSLNLKLSCTF